MAGVSKRTGHGQAEYRQAMQPCSQKMPTDHRALVLRKGQIVARTISRSQSARARSGDNRHKEADIADGHVSVAAGVIGAQKVARRLAAWE